MSVQKELNYTMQRAFMYHLYIFFLIKI